MKQVNVISPILQMRLREFPEVTSELVAKELATDIFLDLQFCTHRFQGHRENATHCSVEKKYRMAEGKILLNVNLFLNTFCYKGICRIIFLRQVIFLCSITHNFITKIPTDLSTYEIYTYTYAYT